MPDVCRNRNRVPRYSKPAHLQTRRIPLHGLRLLGLNYRGLSSSGVQDSRQFGDLVTSEKRSFPGTRGDPGILPRAPEISSEAETRRRVLAEHLAWTNVAPQKPTRAVPRRPSDGAFGRSVHCRLGCHAGTDAVPHDVGCIHAGTSGGRFENRVEWLLTEGSVGAPERFVRKNHCIELMNVSSVCWRSKADQWIRGFNRLIPAPDNNPFSDAGNGPPATASSM